MSQGYEFLLRKYESLDKIEVLLYGEPGTGKTVLAHSFPRPRTLDLDDGLLSIPTAVKDRIIKAPEDWDYATIKETYDSHGYVKKATAFNACTDQIDKWLKESDSWDTLIVDSITAFNVFCVNKGIEEAEVMKISHSRELSDKRKLKISRMQDYGPSMSLFVQFLDWVRSLDKNLVYIAHVYEQKDKEGRIIKRLPLLIGQLRQRITKDFDEVWFADVTGSGDRQQFVTYTKPYGNAIAKSRLGFGRKEEFLTYDKIKAHLKKK